MRGQALIERLRKGPLRQADYAEIAASPGSLRVRIYHLREMGYNIETRSLSNKGRKAGAEYHLLQEPVPTTAAEERARIVAWLRKGSTTNGLWDPEDYADAIERGDHLT